MDKDQMKIPAVDAWNRPVKIRSEHIRIEDKGEHDRAIIDVPGYLRVGCNLNFEGEPIITGDTLRLIMDPKTAFGPDLLDACEKNLRAAIGDVLIFPVVDVHRKPIVRKPDRCYWPAHPKGKYVLDARRGISRDGRYRFEPVPGALHHPWEPGWKQVGSWKTTRNSPVLQVTLWRSTDPSDDKCVAEVDMDYHKNTLKHLFGEVLINELTGRKTHPYVIAQMLPLAPPDGWGITSFVLEAGGEE